MADFQVTFIFNAERQGWSEIFYWTGSSHTDALAAALPVGTARLALLGSTHQLEAIRISDVDILGDSLPDVSLNNQNIDTSAARAHDVPSVAVLGRASAENLYRRQIWVRGMPDKFIEFDPKTGKTLLKQTAAFTAAWDTWSSSLIQKGFELRVNNKATPIQVITGVLVSQGDGLTAIRCPAHGYKAGDMVRIKGCKFANPPGATLDPQGKSLVNGLWQVRDIVNAPPPAAQLNPVDWFEIPSEFGPITPAYVSGGKAQKRVTVFKKIDSMIYLRAAKRDTGRAFFVPRGRARGKRRIPQ